MGLNNKQIRMQNHQKIAESQFFNALAWNGISYSFYKITYTIFTLALYQTLSTELFSAWALLHSIVFFVLLFLDVGLRKSIPRFIPLFSYTKQAHALFIMVILVMQISILLIIGIPFLTACSHYFFPPSLFNNLFFYIITIFLIEGLFSLINTVYQAHFLQNIFGLFHIIALIGETIANITVLKFSSSYPNQMLLLVTLLTNKIISRSFVIIASLSTTNMLLKQRNLLFKHQTNANNNHEQHSLLTPELSLTSLFTTFAKHSLIMWAATLLKSFSERNFLLLLLTKVSGPATANIFKISHDSTLLFQRIIIKTIGVSDTTLLTQTQFKEPYNIKIAFLLLYNTITRITLPLLCLVVFMFFYNTYYTSPIMIFIAFIFILSYCIEIILSPYERILETKASYSALWKSYCPYIIIFPCATAALIMLKINFIIYLPIIQISRIISSLCMRFYAKQLLLLD